MRAVSRRRPGTIPRRTRPGCAGPSAPPTRSIPPPSPRPDPGRRRPERCGCPSWWFRRTRASTAAPRKEGWTEAERDAFMQPYLRTLIDSGEFPHLALMLGDGIPGADDNFERGLRWLLDGVAGDLRLS
ncbi:TetR/AcrR family transcriptional regulator C-terminal domain-containing protein [Streptosporangium minutum]|uniref:TetR/AcrR family transcriptional regulator C-terminal domain-containing protein n=1 Tax=Streptosporangium minutum TaxID=569862 RepID=UPI0024186778|nr:TetR/AcrR family transcriptional regulator C-terminal domain-containing protein [Streptosporangium minutum]